MERVKKKNLDGITRREQGDSENFFSDMEESNSNFTLFWIGTISVLLVVFALLIFLGLSVKRNWSLGQDYTDSQSINFLSFSDRLNNLRGDGHKILFFNQEEFAVAAGLSEEDFPLSGARFEISKEKIRLVGKIKDSLVFWPIGVDITHLVTDGKFRFLIAPDSFENIILSTNDKKQIEEIFERNINSVLEENKFRAEEIILANESIELHLIKE